MCFSSTQGDVYPVESYESFSANQILDAHWGIMTDGDVRSCILITLNYLVVARDYLHLKNSTHPSARICYVANN